LRNIHSVKPTARLETASLATRARIVEAALALFAERGYHGTTIPAVMEKAGVGASLVYRQFANKEALVNVVFREAKVRLARALGQSLPRDATPRAVFEELWARLSTFAADQPTAFRFLELQDHTPYLDGESRQQELAVLEPLAIACTAFQARGVFVGDVPVEVVLACIWGAFVGLIKAARLGYLDLGPRALASARDACWRAFATEIKAGSGKSEPGEAREQARPFNGALIGRHHGDHDRNERARHDEKGKTRRQRPRGA
jgi:AcrR family transcriptional regulator